MTDEQLTQLRASDGKILKITCSDGEILQAKIVYVNEDHRDVICNLLSTNKPEKYKKEGRVCLSVEWDDVTDLQEITK
jgi:hypothetical protein